MKCPICEKQSALRQIHTWTTQSSGIFEMTFWIIMVYRRWNHAGACNSRVAATPPYIFGSAELKGITTVDGDFIEVDGETIIWGGNVGQTTVSAGLICCNFRLFVRIICCCSLSIKFAIKMNWDTHIMTRNQKQKCDEFAIFEQEVSQSLRENRKR